MGVGRALLPPWGAGGLPPGDDGERLLAATTDSPEH